MILLFIAFMSLLQFCLYFISNKSGYKYGKKIVSILFVVGYLLLFPQFFTPDHSDGRYICGLSIIGIYGWFWIFGSLFFTLTFLLYKWFMRYKKSNQ